MDRFDEPTTGGGQVQLQRPGLDDTMNPTIALGLRSGKILGFDGGIEFESIVGSMDADHDPILVRRGLEDVASDFGDRSGFGHGMIPFEGPLEQEDAS